MWMPRLSWRSGPGIPGLWPLAPQDWDDDTFYGQASGSWVLAMLRGGTMPRAAEVSPYRAPGSGGRGGGASSSPSRTRNLASARMLCTFTTPGDRFSSSDTVWML